MPNDIRPSTSAKLTGEKTRRDIGEWGMILRGFCIFAGFILVISLLSKSRQAVPVADSPTPIGITNAKPTAASQRPEKQASTSAAKDAHFPESDVPSIVTRYGLSPADYRKALNGDPEQAYEVGVAFTSVPPTDEEIAGFNSDQLNEWYANCDHLGFKWIEKAAKLGNVHAQQVLGHLYQDGKGVDKDFSLAHKWFTVAYQNAKKHGDTEQIYCAVSNLKGLNKDILTDKQEKAVLAEQDSRWGNVASDPTTLIGKETAVFNPMQGAQGITPCVDSPETFALIASESKDDPEASASLSLQGKLLYLKPHTTVRIEDIKNDQGLAKVKVLSGVLIGQERWVPALCVQKN